MGGDDLRVAWPWFAVIGAAATLTGGLLAGAIVPARPAPAANARPEEYDGP
jgi:hypothetical protein